MESNVRLAELQTLPNVELDGERLWIVEGDVLLNEEQLEAYARYQANEEPESSGMEKLLGSRRDDRIVRWKPGMILTYHFLGATLEDRYEQVKFELAQAASAWQRVCGVTFRHLSEHDELDERHEDALFTVSFDDVFPDELIALAFFPHDAESKRKLRVGPAFFTTDYDRVGVLRHELGHVLGFRHEHARLSNLPLRYRENPNDQIELTEYDRLSVMHYLIEGGGTNDLLITDKDKAGARAVYGSGTDACRYFP